MQFLTEAERFTHNHARSLVSMICFVLGTALLLGGCAKTEQKQQESMADSEVQQDHKDHQDHEDQQEQQDETTVPESSIEEFVDDEAVAAIRSRIQTEDCGLAVAFLGYYEGDNDSINEYLKETGALQEFSFLEDYDFSRTVRAGGKELYLVIPLADQNISVYNWVMDETNGYAGEMGGSCYYEGKGDLFLMICNDTDTVPNAVIITDDGGLNYTPCLNFYDGTLDIPGVYESGQGILDITPDSAVSQTADNDQVFGKWSTTVWDDVNYTVYLVLAEEGVMFFSYTADDDLSISYMGNWTQNEDGDFVFALSRDQMYGEWETTPAQTLQTTVHLVVMSEQLSMNYVSGDALWGNEQTFADSTYVFE